MYVWMDGMGREGGACMQYEDRAFLVRGLLFIGLGLGLESYLPNNLGGG